MKVYLSFVEILSDINNFIKNILYVVIRPIIIDCMKELLKNLEVLHHIRHHRKFII